MVDPLIILQKLSKHRFLGKQNPGQNNPKFYALNAHAPLIISGCKELLSLTNDEYAKKCLGLIIQHTQELHRLAYLQSIEKTPETSQRLEFICNKLQAQEFSLPSVLHTPKGLADTNYKIALTCFYIILLSVALAVGATFGAWYFGFLAAGYFTDVLVMALSAIGIPALCIGLFSYGSYQAQKDPVSEKLSALENNIENFCDSLAAFEDLEIKIDEAESLSL